MNPIIILIVLVLLLISLVIFALVYAQKHIIEIKSTQQNANSDQVFDMLNKNIIGMQQRIDMTTDAINVRLDKAAHVIGQVNKELGSMSEIGRGLKDFQVFLSSPKLRGNIGEQILYEALDQVFSSQQYAKQYKFKEGQIVDAIVKTKDAMIPIDSKFPMESFRSMTEADSDLETTRLGKEFSRTVKKHIDDVARKYILPHEGTVDFAVMYVPSENVYHEIVTNNEIILDHARTRNILLVSPNSFFHFLRVILMGLERAKIEDEAKKIWKLLKALQTEHVKIGEGIGLVNRHLTNAKNAMDQTSNEYTKFTTKIDQISLIE